jgi:ATP/maltotriose-dependent transcriptional regulator MalT
MCLSYLSVLLWVMGHLDQALQRSHEMLALAKQLTHPYSLAYALNGAAEVHRLCGQLPAAHELETTVQVLSHEHGFPFWLADGTVYQGWDLVQQGQGKEGIAHMRHGMVALRTQGVKLGWSYICGMLATAYGQVGQPAEGLSVLAEAMESEDNMNKGALYRIKGELTLQQFQVSGSKFQVKKGPRSKVQSSKSKNTDPRPLTPTPKPKCIFSKPSKFLAISRRSHWSYVQR